MGASRERMQLDGPCPAALGSLGPAEAKAAQETEHSSEEPAFLLPNSTLLDRDGSVFFLPSTLESHGSALKGRSYSQRRKHRSRCSSTASAPSPRPHCPRRSRTSTRSRTLSSRSSVSSAPSCAEETSCSSAAERQPLDAVGDGLRRCRRERHSALQQRPSYQPSPLIEMLSESLWKLSGILIGGEFPPSGAQNPRSSHHEEPVASSPVRSCSSGRTSYRRARRDGCCCRCRGRGRSSSTGCGAEHRHSDIGPFRSDGLSGPGSPRFQIDASLPPSPCMSIRADPFPTGGGGENGTRQSPRFQIEASTLFGSGSPRFQIDANVPPSPRISTGADPFPSGGGGENGTRRSPRFQIEASTEFAVQ